MNIYLATDMLDSEKVENEICKMMGFFCDAVIGVGKEISVPKAVEILEICDSLGEYLILHQNK